MNHNCTPQLSVALSSRWERGCESALAVAGAGIAWSDNSKHLVTNLTSQQVPMDVGRQDFRKSVRGLGR